MLAGAPGGGDFTWLLEKNSRRAVPHWLERNGYRAFRNPKSKHGLWSIKDRQQIVYVRTELSAEAKHEAVQALVDK